MDGRSSALGHHLNTELIKKSHGGGYWERQREPEEFSFLLDFLEERREGEYIDAYKDSENHILAEMSGLSQEVLGERYIQTYFIKKAIYGIADGPAQRARLSACLGRI